MHEDEELVPMLVARGAARAIDFYVRALGASVVARYDDGPERRLGHADLCVGRARFSVTEEAPRWNSDSPQGLGGSAVVMQLFVRDTDAVARRMVQEGASLVFPVQDLLGERMARVRDPFGHLWLLRQVVEALSPEEIQRRRDALFARFAAEARSTSEERRGAVAEDRGRVTDGRVAPQARGTVHLVLGPVGAGKSTFAAALAREHDGVRFALDEWMTRLFSVDRPAEGVVEWYLERAERCVDRIWAIATELADRGTAVVLELGLLTRPEREAFYARVDAARLELAVHVLDAAREVRRERVMKRNETRGATFSMVVPPAVFELASDRWEPLHESECAGRDVRFRFTD